MSLRNSALAASVVLCAAGLAVPVLSRPAGADSGVTVYACVTSSHTFSRVSVNTPLPCPSGAVAVSWPGTGGAPMPSPSPTLTSTSPSPTPTQTTPSPSPTDTTPSPSPSATGTAAACTVPLGQNCGPYHDAQIPMSNGFDTYVANQNVGANTGTAETVAANGPGDWSVTANAVPYGYGGVQTFPDVQQLTNDWNGSGWGGGSGTSNTPLSALSALKVNYSESMGTVDGNTSAEFAPDVWTAEYPSDVMFWADTEGRCNPGAYGGTVLGTAVLDGQTWTVNRYGGPGAEIIFVLDSDPAVPDSCARQQAGTVDVKAGFDWLIANGYLTSATFTQVNTGWEITSAAAETFTMSGYSITAAPA